MKRNVLDTSRTQESDLVVGQSVQSKQSQALSSSAREHPASDAQSKNAGLLMAATTAMGFANQPAALKSHVRKHRKT